MKTDFLSSEGKIGRTTFIVRMVAAILFAVGLSFIAYSYFAHNFHHGEFVTLGIFCIIVFALICHFVVLMQLLKRFRDMGQEAYFSLLMLVPVVNVFLLLYACVMPSKASEAG